MQFADLIFPLESEVFRAEYYDRRPVHISTQAQRGQRIFDWGRLNSALAVTPYWNEESLKIYFRNRAAQIDAYCDVSKARGGKAPVDHAKVQALIGLGASLIANHVQLIDPEVRKITRLLEAEFAGRVFANAYCSFKGVQAFGTHYDLHDVFVLQTEGEKVWHVYEARADAPVSPLPSGEQFEKWLHQSRGKLLFEARMKPGDVLYLPRGQYHDALADVGASLHLTFGVAPATGLALFKLLEGVLAREKMFRDYVPDARDSAGLRVHMLKLASRISEVMASPSFSVDVLNHQQGLAAPMAPNYALPNQHKHDWYAIERPANIVRNDDGYVLAHEGGEIGLGKCQVVIAWMLAQNRFSSKELEAHAAGVAQEEFARLLAKLLGAGIIVPVNMQ